MRGILSLFLFSCVLAASGCVSDTGNVAVEFTGADISGEGNASSTASSAPEGPQENAGTGIMDTAEETPPPEENEPPVENETLGENATGNATHDPCAGKLCDDSITTCPDGEVVSCRNVCSNMSGLCSSCIPDCSDHQLPEEACDIECGDCGILDEESCSCSIILYCSGNGICEPGYDSGSEWPDSPDCIGFGGCDDDDSCTRDVFDPNSQKCVHADICCDDGDECTVDFYDDDSGLCTHTYACCGNGICEPENNETEESCPADCFGEGEEPGDVKITAIDHQEEIVTLEGYGVDMTGWTIEDNASHVYSFPDGFVINNVVYIFTNGKTENSNDTYLFWGRGDSVWNNEGDTATLRNNTGDVVNTFTY